MPIVPFLPAIISAGATVYAAKKASGASEDAVDAETAAADEALRVAEEQNQLERSDTAPWRNTGGWSMTELGRLAGMPDGWTIPDTRPTDPTTPTGPSPVPPTDQPPYVRGGPENTWKGDRPMMQRTGRPEDMHTLRDLQQVGAQQQTASSFVRVQAPDGETRDVPEDEAAYYVSKGARRVG